jgi:hypothetical protein
VPPLMSNVSLHKPPMRLTICAFTLAQAISLSASAQPQVVPQQELAAQLFDATVALQAEPVVDRLLKGAARQSSMPQEAVPIYRELALELFRSAKYRQAYIEAYTKTFSTAELRTLLDLSAHPGFSLYLSKGQQITELTYPVYLELLNASRPELERRLQAAGLAPK